MQPVNFDEIASILQNIVFAFDDYIVFTFVVMVSFSIVFFIYKLFVGRVGL